jgi:hypothetical protein
MLWVRQEKWSSLDGLRHKAVFEIDLVPCIWVVGGHTKISQTVHCLGIKRIVIKAFCSPTDGQVNCLKRNVKFALKLTLKQLRYISVQLPSSGSVLFGLAKVTVVKIIN